MRLTHNPPVIGTSSTTEEFTFYVEDTIQNAIDKANEVYTLLGGTDQIMAYVPAGIYKNGEPGFKKLIGSQIPPDPPFKMKDGVYLKGAGNGGEETAAAGKYTMIDLEDTYYDNGGIFYLNDVSNVTIDSFRLTGGSGYNGGAIFLDQISGTILIKNNTLLANHAYTGGAIWADGIGRSGKCEFLINNNIIIDNFSATGGGIFINQTYQNSSYTLSENTIQKNYATGGEGGGFFSNFLEQGEQEP